MPALMPSQPTFDSGRPALLARLMDFLSPAALAIYGPMLTLIARRMNNPGFGSAFATGMELL